jgi:hypothetical protein
MQLKTDDRCRLASRDLFKPNASYGAEKTPDGAIRLVELEPKKVGKAQFFKKNGRILLDIGRPSTWTNSIAIWRTICEKTSGCFRGQGSVVPTAPPSS